MAIFDIIFKEHEGKPDRHLLEQILGYIHYLNSKISLMSTQLDALTAQVTANNSAIESAITLLQNIKAALDAAIASQPTDDGAALQALSDSLGSEDQKLADAITANTPAAPAA